MCSQMRLGVFLTALPEAVLPDLEGLCSPLYHFYERGKVALDHSSLLGLGVKLN